MKKARVTGPVVMNRNNSTCEGFAKSLDLAVPWILTKLGEAVDPRVLSEISVIASEEGVIEPSVS